MASPAFAGAIVKGHRVISRVSVVSSGAVTYLDLPVTDGKVAVDKTASIRRTCSLTVVDKSGVLIPTGASSMLAPYGNELTIYRGIRLSTGDELLALGVFRISAAEVVDAGSRTIRLSGYDRSRRVARARFDAPYTIAAGVNYATAIQTLIESRVPGLTYNLASTTRTTPLLVFDEAADPWAAAMQMAQSIGNEIFFDVSGAVVLRPEPDPATQTPMWTYSEGVNATVLSISNVLTDEPGYNGFVVDGEAVEVAPVHSVVYDINPLSPTNSNGPYGKVPTFLKSQFITSQAQADEAAAAGLLRERGGTEQVKLSAIPNPMHEAGDVVSVVNAGLGLNDNYIVEGFEIPLDVDGSMSITTRRRRTS